MQHLSAVPPTMPAFGHPLGLVEQGSGPPQRNRGVAPPDCELCRVLRACLRPSRRVVGILCCGSVLRTPWFLHYRMGLVGLRSRFGSPMKLPGCSAQNWYASFLRTNGLLSPLGVTARWQSVSNGIKVRRL